MDPELKIDIHVLPGGKMPERKTEGAIGYDVFLRAIVSAKDMDPKTPYLRKMLFDFIDYPDDPEIKQFVREPEKDGGFAYRLEPSNQVLVGIGFVIAMEFPWFHWVTGRSGLSSVHGINLGNAPGTVDPDYRGEAGVIVRNESTEPFLLRRNMRIAQIVFQRAEIPDLVEVFQYSDLPISKRGAGGFGSTGNN